MNENKSNFNNEPIKWQEILSFDRMPLVDEGMKNCEFAAFKTPYNKNYFELDNDKKKFNFLGNGRLYDLGCGEQAINMVKFAMERGCKEYNGVDLDDAMYRSILTIRSNIEDYSNIKSNFTKGDMLSYLKKLPDNSGNITVNGIDDCIINPKKIENENYLERVVKEILRVIGKDYILFGINSPVIFERIRDEKIIHQKLSDFNFYSQKK